MRWRSVSEPRVFVSDSRTERSTCKERFGPHPRWLRSSSSTVIVSVSLEADTMTVDELLRSQRGWGAEAFLTGAAFCPAVGQGEAGLAD